MSKYTSHINQDEISHYLKELRKLPVITPEREKELSKIMLNPNVTQQEIDMVHKELLEGNLRFVITVAKDYQGQGIDLGDLISEGNLGLMKAIKSFEWERGLRFISYAVWWVKQSIFQCLNENSRTIRLPVNVVQEVQKAKKQDKNVEDINPRLSNLAKAVTFDDHINEEGDTMFDLLEDEDALMPDAGLDGDNMVKKQLMKIMEVLDDRENAIVRDYFGIVGTPRTLEDIGSDFGLTKERVRQIKEKALRKLRNESDVIFDYL
jgi:RNA polymerase primary sigma factor